MTLPVEAEDVAPNGGDVELDLIQAMEDCLKMLQHGPVWPLTTTAGWETGQELACLLGSMLSTAEVDRRIRGQS